jgi:hypothetical protein
MGSNLHPLFSILHLAHFILPADQHKPALQDVLDILLLNSEVGARESTAFPRLLQGFLFAVHLSQPEVPTFGCPFKLQLMHPGLVNGLSLIINSLFRPHFPQHLLNGVRSNSPNELVSNTQSSSTFLSEHSPIDTSPGGICTLATSFKWFILALLNCLFESILSLLLESDPK